MYILQSRPITTISKGDGGGAEKAMGSGKVILTGLGASPGVATGEVKIVSGSGDLGKIKEGDILVTVMTEPDMVPAMKRAGAIVTDEGGMTCHAPIVSRELATPGLDGRRLGLTCTPGG